LRLILGHRKLRWRGFADLRHVQALLGHSDIDTTAKYLGLVKQDLKLAYDQAIERLLAED